MQFDIHGDKIIYQGNAIGTLHNGPWIGLRIECENLLRSLPDLDSMVTEDEHAKAIGEAVVEAEEAIKDELNEKHEKDIEIATDKAREEAREAGFNEGRADALEATQKAADVFRVDALLAALADAESLLRAPLNGIREAGSVKRRPVKIGELKDEVRKVAEILGRALQTYRG